jgi:acetyl esterase/lipase
MLFRPRPRRGNTGGLTAVGLAVVMAVDACGQQSAPPSTTVPASFPAASLPSPSFPTPSFPTMPMTSCADNQDGRYVEERFAVSEVTTVEYSGDLQADIYRPAADPAICRVGVVWVHGGGFTQASRNGTAERAWGAALAGRGYLFMSIDYRLGSGEPFGLDQAIDPDRSAVVAAAIDDATTAVRWLRAAATQWGVDPGRLIVGGTSAGAMTALGSALTAPIEDRPCAVVSVSGDLDRAWVGDDPVPALFVHGDQDSLVPFQSAVDAVQALTSAGGHADLVTISGAGHEITGVPPSDVVIAVTSWLRGWVAAEGC